MEQDVTKNIWGFGHRREYIARLQLAGKGTPKGPHAVRRFHGTGIPYEDRSSAWGESFIHSLRELALSYWIGSEFDVAVIRILPRDFPLPNESEVLHVFDALSHKALGLNFGYRWSDDTGRHIGPAAVDLRLLCEFLLTFYNAVFLDDIFAQKSAVYYHERLPVEVPRKIRIHTDGREAKKYMRVETQKHTELDVGTNRGSIPRMFRPPEFPSYVPEVEDDGDQETVDPLAQR